jgi:cobalt-zinc-cadmium efflux system protein
MKGRKLIITIILNTVITVSQVIGGLVSGSLSLLSDALHNFTDVVSLIISYTATILSKKEASTHRTFGYKRAEIIAAFVNSAILVIVAVILIIEAIKRFNHPQNIESELVIWLSFLAILANGFSVLLIKKQAKDNMNMRSAYLHLLTDMLASVAVLIGGLLMKFYQLFWVDTVLTLAIALYLIWVSLKLLRESFNVLMLFTPDSVQIENIVADIQQHALIKNVHHVHIWQLNDSEMHFEAHIDFFEDIKLSEFEAILNDIEKHLLLNYHINHVNIQPEFRKDDSKFMIVQD